MSQITEEQIAEIEGLLAKATEGPWVARQEFANRWRLEAKSYGPEYLPLSLGLICTTILEVGVTEQNTADNAEFIVALVNAAPALLSAARRGIVAGAADVGALREALRSARDAIRDAQRGTYWSDGGGALAQIDAALSQPPAPAEGWRPIETAPEDGRAVLLWWSTRGASVGRYENDDMFSERPSSWVSPESGWCSDGDRCIPVNQEHCTHWMPLPASPEARS